MAKVVLSDGKNVEISTVLFNKEQSINVPKTYVATVKKNVSKVAFDFYKLDINEKKDNTPFEANDNSIFVNLSDSQNNSTVNESVEINNNQEVKSEEQVEEKMPVLNETPKVDDNAVLLNTEDKEKKLQPSLVSTEPEPVVTLSTVAPVTEPVLSTPTVNNIIEPVLPVVDDTPDVKAQESVQPVASANTNVVPANGTENKEEIKSEPVPVAPISVIPTVGPVSAPVSDEPKLFFDGSKETNLNQALGEVSNDKVVTTEAQDVQSLREFGISDKVLSNENMQQETPIEVVSQGPVKKRSLGFANNKFFMIVAILLFAAACAFLGYEAFQYFTMTK